MTKTASLDLDPFIETANAMVTEACSDLGLSTTQLELIERWLSAHLYQMADPAIEEKKIGQTSKKQPKVEGQGVMSTRYGQMAVQLGYPSTGAGIAIAWLGKEEDE